MKKVMVSLLFLILLLSACKLNKFKEARIIDLTIEECDGDKHLVSFMVDNMKDSAVDCYAEITIDEQINLYDVGIIPAKNKKTEELTLSFKTGDTQIKIEPVCEEVDELIVKNCGEIEDLVGRLACKSTKENPALQQCVTRKTKLERIFCAALLSNDAQLCYHILTPKKHWCIAYITGDHYLCEEMDSLEEKDLCYMDIGMNKQAESLCNKIHDEAKKITCEAVLNLDADMCLEGDEKNVLACVANVAEFTGNVQLCEKLTDLREECYSWLGK